MGRTNDASLRREWRAEQAAMGEELAATASPAGGWGGRYCRSAPPPKGCASAEEGAVGVQRARRPPIAQGLGRACAARAPVGGRRPKSQADAMSL